MKKAIVVVPIMILVTVLAMWMLEKDYSVIEYQTRIIISVGAGILSGIISFFLFSLDNEKK